jgi:hypothetical protein
MNEDIKSKLIKIIERTSKNELLMQNIKIEIIQAVKLLEDITNEQNSEIESFTQGTKTKIIPPEKLLNDSIEENDSIAETEELKIMSYFNLL